MSLNEDDVFAGLEGIFDDVDPDDYEDLTLVDSMELLERFHAVTEELKENKGAWLPKTRDNRDLHSVRYALQVELRRRDFPV